MKRIYTIGLTSDISQPGLPIELFLPLGKAESDNDLHDFIIKELLEKDFDALHIPFIQENAGLAFRLALHIRLTERLLAKRLCNIVLSSNLLVDTVIKNAGIHGYILTTAGTKYLQNPTSQIISAVVEKLHPLTVDKFVSHFLHLIIVKADEKIGRHSLANIWGAKKLEQSANLNILSNIKTFEVNQQSLFFKYASAFNYNYASLKPSALKILGKIQLRKPDKIEAHGKKILLIDDEADKGWSLILERLFQLDSSSDFQVIQERVGSYEDFSQQSKELIENHSYDLFLLDLRLKGVDEEKVINTEKMSGANVLKKLKAINAGNQVVIFTASNKVWNLKSLLLDNADYRADGYYLKESPDFNFSEEVSYQNYLSFKETVLECLELSHLREFWRESEFMKKMDFSKCSQKFRSFAITSIDQMDIAYELLALNRKRESHLFKFAFLTYFQIIENFSNSSDNFDFLTNEVIINGYNKVAIFKDNSDGSQTSVLQIIFEGKRIKNIFYKTTTYTSQEQKIKTTTLTKFISIGYLKMGLSEKMANDFISLNEIRNSIAHPNKNSTITIQEVSRIFEYVKEIFQWLHIHCKPQP